MSCVYYRFEEDYLAEAGTKFKVGDIVTIDFTGKTTYDIFCNLFNIDKYEKSKLLFKIAYIPEFDDHAWSNYYSCITRKNKLDTMRI